MAMALLPKIEKKPSCILTNVVSTCVNKASSHLELLQTLIEEWFVNAPAPICGGHSAASKGNYLLPVSLTTNFDSCKTTPL